MNAGRLRPLHLAVGGGVGVLALLAVFDPAISAVFPPCPFRAATGWLCPGCGAARALHALLHGHVIDAIHQNAVAVAALPLAGADVLQRLRSGAGLPTHVLAPRWILLLAIGLVAFGVVRNF